MLALDVTARYAATTLDVALEELRKADLSQRARDTLLSLLSIARDSNVELCEALGSPYQARPAETARAMPVGAFEHSGNVIPFRQRRSRPCLATRHTLSSLSAKAKAEGVYKGRKPTIDVAKVREMQSSGLGASAIAKALGIGRASVYRVLGETAS